MCNEAIMYQQMKAACEQIGVKMLSDDTCCKLLALVYVYGDESAVYSEVLRRDVETAVDRCGIGPGRLPSLTLVERIAHYVKHLNRRVRPAWLDSIEERYGVKFPALTDWQGDARANWKEHVHGKATDT